MARAGPGSQSLNWGFLGLLPVCLQVSGRAIRVRVRTAVDVAGIGWGVLPADPHGNPVLLLQRAVPSSQAPVPQFPHL